MINNQTQKKISDSSRIDPVRVARTLQHTHAESIENLNSLIHHPRSLARPLATWRPPKLTLPAISTQGQLIAAISRYRVGTEAQHIIRESGENSIAAYLISMRVSSSSGYKVPEEVAQTWIRALIPAEKITCVHRLSDEPTPTFCWVVDSRFKPLHCPTELFENTAQAA